MKEEISQRVEELSNNMEDLWDKIEVNRKEIRMEIREMKNDNDDMEKVFNKLFRKIKKGTECRIKDIRKEIESKMKVQDKNIKHIKEEIKDVQTNFKKVEDK